MKRPSPTSKSWALFLLLPIYLFLAWIFTRLSLNDLQMEFAQLGMLGLIFFLVNYWIGANESDFISREVKNQALDPTYKRSVLPARLPLEQLPFVRRGRHALLAAGIVMAATVLMALIGRSLLGEGVIALLYLIPIGWVTVRWGRLPGASSALSAALCFDFFFIPPYFTFRIGSLEGWLLLVLFMLASLVVVGRTVTIFSEIKRREKDNNFMYELLLLMGELQTREQVAEFFLAQLVSHYKVGFAKIVLYQSGILPSFVMVKNAEGAQPVMQQPERSLPIYSNRELIGKIMIGQAAIPLPADNDPLLQSICHLVALGMERAQPVELQAGNLTGAKNIHSGKTA